MSVANADSGTVPKDDTSPAQALEQPQGTEGVDAPVEVEPRKRTARVLLPADDGSQQVDLEKAVASPAVERDADDTDDEGDEKEDDADADGEAEEGDFLADFPDDTDDLELIHCRLKSLDELRLPRFADHLKRLSLRQNAISRLDPATFHQLTKLEEVDLYDNKLKDVGDAFDKLGAMTSLDLSFNLLRSVPSRLESMPRLSTIYFVQNKISKVSGLSSLVNLRSLELGGNKIRKIENLETLVNLEELWLGKNKITKLEGLGTLKKLKILSIQSNRITVLEGLEELESLDQLYLSHNGIKKIEGLDHNVKLTTLDIQYNFVEKIENVSHLKELEEFWMSGNKIPDLTSVDKELRNIETLRTLYLEANPCQTNDRANYRRKVMLTLPQLTQIDATYVRA
ncbi:protein phosphatase regulatory subunit [Ephemerocybe angulata]|uniref:Protein phosphatase regulatory subunit n=1 Tax=Ephemerocybe angulata TaxID=980116 RepID=A0A8H6I3J3_9AGAR|nr:protein phosphatase regulatory subunit [Tulosesus angulatus]